MSKQTATYSKQTLPTASSFSPSPSSSSSSSSTSQEELNDLSPNPLRGGDNRAPEHHKSPNKNRSFIEYYGCCTSFCGYCKSKGNEGGGRTNYDFRAQFLYPNDYQMLIDRGWRRSGNYCYHPVNSQACCPNYPISSSALNFKFTKSHRKVVENMNLFLMYGAEQDRSSSNVVPLKQPDYQQIGQELPDKLGLWKSRADEQPARKSSRTFEEVKLSSKARDRRFVKSCERKTRLYNLKLEDAIVKTKERSQARRSAPDLVLEDYLFPRKAGENSIEPSFELKHKLTIRLVQVSSLYCESKLDDEHKIIQKYQRAVHQEDSDSWTLDKFSDFLVVSPLVPILIPDRKYVKPEHKDSDVKSVDVYSNEDFLIVKPPQLPTHYGTYHCLYILDKELIAVGVLDVLPKCITTVYFFYNPVYGHLNLGIYSALVEISIVRQMAKHYSGPPEKNELKYYHIGFYVHECKKMHYKTRFRPARLLCSETWQYVPLETCLDKLKTAKYARFCTDPSNKFSIYTSEPTMDEISKVKVLTALSRKPIKITTYFDWLRANKAERYVGLLCNNLLVPFASVVGSSLLPRLIIDISNIHRTLCARLDSETKGHKKANEH